MTRQQRLLAIAAPLAALVLASCQDNPEPTAAATRAPGSPMTPHFGVASTANSVLYSSTVDTLIIDSASVVSVADGEITGTHSASVEAGTPITLTGRYQILSPICATCGFNFEFAQIGWIVPEDSTDQRFAEVLHTIKSYNPVNFTPSTGKFTWTTRAPFVPGAFKIGALLDQPQPFLPRAGFGFDLSTPDLTNRVYASFEVAVKDPALMPTVSGTLGGGGWYRSDVKVSWAVKTATTTIQSSTGCDTTLVTTDTSSETVTCAVVASNGPKSKSVTVKRDATKP